MSIKLISDELQKTLIKNGFTDSYIARIEKELSDHKEDIISELNASGADIDTAALEAQKRLGTPEEISSCFISSVRSRTFFGRHSGISFILLPFLLVLIIIMAAMVLGEVISGFFSFFNPELDWHSEPLFTIMQVSFILLNNTVTVFITVLFCLQKTHAGSEMGRDNKSDYGCYRFFSAYRYINKFKQIFKRYGPSRITEHQCIFFTTYVF